MKTNSKTLLWTGRILSILCILFMILDAVMKIIKAQPAMDGSTQLGWPAEYIQGIGITLLICTILYAIPRTSVIGVILMTAYLGGAGFNNDKSRYSILVSNYDGRVCLDGIGIAE